MAGLSAASALAEGGCASSCSKRAGSSVAARPRSVNRETGELVDNRQHVLFGCYRETFRLLRRIDAEGHVRMQPSLEVPYLDESGRRLGPALCPALPSPLHLVAPESSAGTLLSWGDRLSILRVAGPLLAAQASR